MILNFKEIPRANKADGNQDTFELFARDFLKVLGYSVLQSPDRGADGKKDLIVIESRQGISGVSQIKWLVSCKHHAHSGKSVSDKDEPNIQDRVTTHKCDGFLGFYSTLPSSSLGANLKGLKQKIPIQHFDKEEIETILLESPNGMKLASRYFPESFKNYQVENPKPAKIFSNKLEIKCEYCSNNLLDSSNKGLGIFVTLRNTDSNQAYHKQPYSDAYFACKGKCDFILKNKYLNKDRYIDEWVDISDYTYPAGFIKKVMAWLNSSQIDNVKIENDAFEKLKQLFLHSFPYVSRELTTEEKENVKFYLENGLQDYI